MGEPSSARDQLAARISSLSDIEVAELLEYIKIMETMRLQLSSPLVFEDEVARLLGSPGGERPSRLATVFERARRRTVRTSPGNSSTTYLT